MRCKLRIGPNCSVADSLQAHAGIAFAIALYQSWISRPLSHPGDQATYVLKMDDLRREQVGMKEKVPEHNQAADGVRWNEQRYRTLFELGPVAVYSCDAAGVIQEFNRRAVELWGCEPVLGDTDKRFCGSFKLFRPDGTFMPHEQCPMAEVVAGTLAEASDAKCSSSGPTARGLPSS